LPPSLLLPGFITAKGGEGGQGDKKGKESGGDKN